MMNGRFVNNTLSELQEVNHSPISGYEDSPFLTLEEAVEKVVPLVSRAMDHVATAKQNYNRNSTLLTCDESAAIYLYSMPTSFFSHLNNSLRTKNRQALKPWFAFLKLFITALEKLPSTGKTVWRGVSGEVDSLFANNDMHIWWSINSCSMALNIVQLFLGDQGTLFAIDTIDGKDISTFSAFPAEQEVILMPGTRVRAKGKPLNFIDRLIVVHLEEINSQSETESESSYLFDQIRQVYQRNGRIQRIMNPAKSFPIQQSYINIAIVNAKEQNDKEKQLRDAQHSNDIMGSFEDIYGMKTAIDVKNIFDTCKNQEKQVLVFGRAGIGKSTFSRYVAYQWATRSYWSQYELLALIPLRRLTADRYPPLPLGQNYSLIDLLKKEVFDCELSENDERLLKRQYDAKTTLWILDGHDEVVQNVPPHLKYLLEQLLKTPHHILTSRPYMNTLSYDVQMEIIGFTNENIVEYVQQFFNEMNDELDNASIKNQTLLNFLRSNRSVWGVAHIPVNLELICSVWSNEDLSETKELKITALYSMMTEWLCRRYLTAQNIQIQKVSKTEIYQRCQKELAFLESLAFNATESNIIIIRPTLLEQALDEAKVSLQDYPDVLNIGILKSFNKQGTGTQIEIDKDHYFVHLSFQEYFAARYLNNALRGSRIEKAIEFIRHRKYNQRYALVFTFVSGLLNDSAAKSCLDTFWDTILQEPLDLVGIRHMQLVISCIEETYDKTILPRRTELLEWIAKCIRCSFSTKNKIIRKHLLPSLQRAQSVTCDQTIISMLINLFQYGDTDTKTEVFPYISEFSISDPSSELITLMITALNDQNDEVRQNACKALGKMGTKAATNEVIRKLVSALGDESRYVRENACKALGNMDEKAATNEVISRLSSALGDKNYWVRWYAAEALAKMGEKAATNVVISKLVSALGDENADVRQNASEALRKMGEKTATNEVISNLLNALEDESRYVRENACKALGNMGEKAATNEVISKLVSVIGDECIYVRQNACKALGKIGGKAATNEVISRLVNALGDESAYVRQNACEALQKMGGKAATNEVISKLISALGDENAYVRQNAYQAVGNMGEKAATNEVISKLLNALGDESRYVRENACKTLGNMGEKAAMNEVISRLSSALGDENYFVRWYAAEALGKMGGKAAVNEVISKLVSALGDENADVRQNASKALQNIGEKTATNEVISELLNALEDESRYVRENACKALGNMGEKGATNEVISKLVSVLGDECIYVRHNACEALGKIGGKAATNEVISKLVSALGDEREYVRGSACIALVRMGEKAATNDVISKLVSALGDERAYVRWKACKALGNIGEKAATNDVISKLVSALGDDSVVLRREACEALGKMSEKAATNEVISKLVSALGDDADVSRNACEALVRMGEKAATNDVISKLVSALGDDSVVLRREACEVLGKMGEKAGTNEVISKLVSALGGESESVRRNACEALGNIGEKAATNEVISKLLSALEDANICVKIYACYALRNMGEKAATNEVISKLVSVLGDENADVRQNACEALGNMGEKAATNEVISKLLNALEDANRCVRIYACNALGNMNQKAATDGVISKLVTQLNSGDHFVSVNAGNAIGNIVSSSAMVTQLSPKIVSDLCLAKGGSVYLKNASLDQLVNIFFITENASWLSAASQFSILVGAAVTVTGEKVVVYGRKEPVELSVPTLKLRSKLIKAFIDQSKRLHLAFESLPEKQNICRRVLAFVIPCNFSANS